MRRVRSPRAPRTPRSVDVTQVTEWENGVARRVEDYLAGEEPLEMRLGRRSLGVTLRTPGNDPELVAGFLFTEGIITRREQLVSLRAGDDSGGSFARANVVSVRLRRGAKLGQQKLRRRFSAGSACGVCGKASIAEVRRRGLRRPDPASRFDPETLCLLPEKLRGAQAIFGRTGGLHAAALFDLASVSAPSSLAVQLARELGLTLVGFLRGWRFIIYAGEERLGVSASASMAQA